MSTFAGIIDLRGRHAPIPRTPTLPLGFKPRTTVPSMAEMEAMAPDWLKDSWRMEEEIGKELVRTMVRAFAAGVDYVSITANGREVGRIYRDGRLEDGEPW